MRKIGVFLLFGVLGACVMPTDDMINNDFSAVRAVPAPPGMPGKWTGSNGPYLMTIFLEQDGTGLSCYGWGNKQSVGRIKFDGGQLRFQDGTRIKLARQGEKLLGRAPYTSAQDIVFVSDPELSLADPYCSKNL
ncbi:hypothetical protein OH708_03680 [Pseudomonas capsici]|uniref:J517_1871 family lipoprotein n=1 Tax=Pseudomonas capsici TaxID=2810614 RepID=UPI0021F13CB9|nr:J517_1871 family lipoprotein [Pseudomonas capsici]MCV4287002.1 hypothetical protein [Pseudomonas capsici]